MDKVGKIIIITGIVWAVLVVVYFALNSPIADLRNIRIEQTFALTAFFCLYIALIANSFEFLKKYQKTFILLAFFFGFFHASVAFFFLLGGFAGLGFLSPRFILGISLSLTSLIILLLLVISFIDRLPAFFKHRYWLNIIYLIGMLISVHALLLGSHFIILSNLIPRIFFVSIGILLLLEARRLDRWMRDKQIPIPTFGLNFVLVLIAVCLFGYYYFNPATTLPSTSIHSGHTMTNILSTKRYSLSFNATPLHPNPNQNVNLNFKVFDADTGTEVTQFDIINDKLLHLVIVDESLKFFNHIHPENSGSQFNIATQFPHNGVYHLYVNYQPKGGAEQQVGFSLQVGGNETVVKLEPDTTLSKIVGNKAVGLSTSKNESFLASLMSMGAQTLVFSFKDTQTNQPITNLEPYLGAFGHLVLINQDTYEYIHVHPIASENPNAGGPEVKFLPAALYSKINPGIYRIFGQFKHLGEVFVVDFTIKVN
jgi:hypothetical protein